MNEVLIQPCSACYRKVDGIPTNLGPGTLYARLDANSNPVLYRHKKAPENGTIAHTTFPAIELDHVVYNEPE